MGRLSSEPMDILKERILSLPGVRQGGSRFGRGAAYLIGGREIAHRHGRLELDLRLTRGLIRERRDQLSDDRRVAFRPGASDWLTITLRDLNDVGFAFALFEAAWRAAQ